MHRDISPSNILVSYEGDVKVADFGIAKAEQNTYNTADGVLKGKFEYMSPEQARGESLDHRSDLFSLGIITYEMLTGRRLFKSDSDTATLEKIKRGDFLPPGKVHSRVPERLERIVMKALAQDRDDRYTTAREMQDDLLEFLYPATPDVTRGSMARFMQALFAEEIGEERSRLESGSRIAEELRDSAPSPDEWDGQATETLSPPSPMRTGALSFLGLGIGLLLLGIGASAALLGWILVAPPTQEVVTVEREARTGVLDVTVVPTGRITINGEPRGDHPSLTLEDVEPGVYSVRIEAEGQEAHEETVTVVAGQIAKVRHTFAVPPPQAPAPEADPSPEPTGPAPARVRFTSEPSGATVFVNNDVKGRTPLTWSGSPGRTYKIEYQLAGHAPTAGTLSGLERGRSKPFSLTMQKAVVRSAEATLVVSIAGGGWGDVFVDGSNIGRAPISAAKGITIAPGEHTIEVKNPGAGLDWSDRVSCTPGAQCKVRATRN